MTFLTKTDLQKGIGKLKDLAYILLSRGKPKNIILPYFDGSQDWIEDYLEDYEMWKNQQKLKKEMEASIKSGKSDLVI